MAKMNKNARIFRTLFIVTFIWACIFLVGCIFTTIMWLGGNKKATAPTPDEPIAGVMYSEDEVNQMIAENSATSYSSGHEDALGEMKESIECGNSIMETLRNFYPDYLVYMDGKQYAFEPITDAIPLATYDESGITINGDTGEITYCEGDNVLSKKGVDVSKYQEKIDWGKVKADGVDYAMIRVGIRGYGSGAIVEDETFEANMKGALSNNIEVGAYFFSQAINEEEAREEARLVIEKLAPYKITYPVAIDIETVNDSTARTANLTKDERTTIAIAFLEEIKNAGYDPMIYGNLKSFCGMLDSTRLIEYKKWFAFYDSFVYYPYDIYMWQYTEKGSVSGIKDGCDLNITFN